MAQTLTTAVATVMLLSAGVALRAQEAAPAPAGVPVVTPAAADAQKQFAELEARRHALDRDLQAVRMRLGLVPGRGPGDGTDPEIRALMSAADAARKAVEAKGLEKMKADPDGAALLAQLEEKRAQRAALDADIRKLEEGMGPIAHRLGLMPARGGTAAFTPDAEMAPLIQAAEAARKAYEDKGREKLQADAAGAALLAEQGQVQEQLSSLRQRMAGERGRERGGERAPERERRRE